MATAMPIDRRPMEITLYNLLRRMLRHALRK
jgi:hypothetical protein